MVTVLRTVRNLCVWREQMEESAVHLEWLLGSLLPQKELEDRLRSGIVSEEELDDNASPELSKIGGTSAPRGLKSAPSWTG